ncbi:replication protein A 70 kDa DNA-binding subunit A-like [Senna tora]|uniref:Replication protein A 70 kDa DNA-binding subunit A-like n=1 Tax=Senna tora TaxID=362788 RepID=A0A834X0M1_9FABA|nr:replication protein A 70 kDa DNA-binding subunit A-like [Senna tora]
MFKGSQGAAVIVFQFCKIKEYAGTQSLSNSMYATRILINDDVEELREFHESIHPEDLNTPFNPIAAGAFVTTSPIEAAFNGLSHSPVNVLKHSGNGEVICVLAQVLQVNKQRGCSENITVFDRNPFNYISMTANDLAAEKLKMEAYTGGWPEKIDCFIGKKFVFKVGIKISKWNSYTSLTVQRMKNDPVIYDKFSGYSLAQVLYSLPPYIDLQSGQSFQNFNLWHFVSMQERLKYYVGDKSDVRDMIDLTSNFEDLSTPTKNKSKQSLNVGGRRFSFIDAEASASIETPITGKRSATVLCDDGQSSEDFALISEATNKKNKM